MKRRSMHVWQRFAVMLIPAILIAAAPANPTTAPAEHALTPGKTYVIHLPGIGGLMRIDRLLTGGLTNGGLKADIQVYDWTNGNPGLPALGAIDRNKVEARKVAELIVRRLRDEPDARIILTGHSGGSGVAVWALESLPDGVRIDALVMLAPALSPTYDLSMALHRVDRAYSFNSQYDPILGPGTRAFGTIDRIMTHAAGRVGFVRPQNGDVIAYEKLIQIPYDRGFMAFGNVGDHIGPMMPRFAARVIAPLLLTGELPPGATTAPATRPAETVESR